MLKQNTDMYTYIREEADQCRINIANAEALTKDAVTLFCSGSYSHILIVASGSSYNASVSAAPFIESVLNVKCDVYASYTFSAYGRTFGDSSHTFVFGAGQSGRSSNTNAALDKARALGLPTVGLTAETASEMRNHCDVISDWGVGIEKNGCVTKGYTTLILYFMLFSVQAAAATGRIDSEKAALLTRQLGEACDVIAAMVESTDAWYQRNAAEFSELKRVQVLGCGAGYGSALEGALKIAETACIPSNAYEQEEFLHGPCFEDNSQYSVFVIDSCGPSSDRAIQLYHALHYLTDHVYLVTNRGMDDSKVVSVAHNLPSIMTPLFNAIPFQVLSAIKREGRKLSDNLRKMNEAISTKSPQTGNERGF